MAKINDLLLENEKLRSETESMVSLLKENEILAKNFKKVQYGLLLCDNFNDISEKALKFAEIAFKLDRVTLFIYEKRFSFTYSEQKQNDRVFLASTEAFDYTFLEMRPFYGKEPVIIHETFRVYENQGGYSFVIVPIIIDEKIYGALGFYSADPARFNKEQNFDFLNETAFIAGICLKRLEDAYLIKKRSQNDYLTGLPNKSVMDESIHRWIERYKDFGAAFSFVILNLSNFSFINQYFGHKRGDEVLKRAGSSILKIVGENGTVGRFGGDEFYLFLNADDEEKLSSIMDNITKDINDIAGSMDIRGRLGINGGGVRVPHDLRKAKSLDELLQLVFERLAKAKKEGFGAFIGV